MGMRARGRTRGGRWADFGGRAGGPRRSLASVLGGHWQVLADEDGCRRAAMDGVGRQIATAV